MGDVSNLVKAKKATKIPVVFERHEVNAIFTVISPTHKLPVQLMYGSGLRLMECLRLRIKDIDFNRMAIIGKNHETPHPARTSDRYCVFMAAFFCLRFKPALKVLVLFNIFTAICRKPVSISAALPLLIRQSSSRIATSIFQWSLW